MWGNVETFSLSLLLVEDPVFVQTVAPNNSLNFVVD